ncbi:DUF2505 domain-containing protein [Nocardioides gilvus]|uniref:DUF2505 domain-containing protein n=1 Tax=Nocardioides gilvus TaxID=1735589 RepID=UPI000D749DFE|nr:DUF2505 domain-containing protein [Nocardioides gilvus]
MTKRLEQELTYDAPLADVAAMLRDPSFREKVCTRQRVLSHQIDITDDGDAADIRIERLQAVEKIPSFAAKVVGDQITIVQREEWSDLHQGTYSVGIPDKPGHISGTVTLTERGGRCVETISLDIKVSIPLVGGKLEGVVHGLLTSALRTEHEVGTAHLAG